MQILSSHFADGQKIGEEEVVYVYVSTKDKEMMGLL